MNFKKTILTAAALLTGSMAMQAQQLAFPEAQGWGRWATGGRAGTVYHVTNLNDSGSGSLRDAVSAPNRIIVFDVAGVIKLNSMLVFKNNLYVAGQTAPGEGVTVYGGRVSFSGASNTIVRYMRFRLGHAAGQVDCAGAANGHDMIFDHCSFAWGGDETFSLNPDGKNGGLYNVTLSNSIMGQGLMPHSAGGLIQADSVTLYRNLYCDNSTRNNKVKGRNQYANNIVYNWSNGCYIMGGDSEGQSYANIESNLFINGPAKGGAALGGGNSNFHFYGDDNWQDSNIDGKFDPSLVTTNGGSDRVSKPYPYPTLDLYNGDELLDKNLPYVGASLPYRDYVDCYMVDEVLSYGKQGALIANEDNLFYGVPTTWSVWKGDKRVDTDGDGMPDAWETANGTDPNKNDAMVKAANGYANIENYINSITKDDRQYFLRTPVNVEQASSTTTTMTLSWRDWTDNEEGYVVEVMNSKGAYEEAARTAANAKSVVLSGLEPGTQYKIRVRAFAGEEYSAYTPELTFATRPLVVGLIDTDTFVGDLTILDSNTPLEDGAATLIAPTENITVTVPSSVIPEDIVVRTDADVTIQGTGSIYGSGSMNKAGKGTLKMNIANNYTGATVLHDGVFEFNSVANGGVESAIGKSVEFAQNWIWDGGTYRYTGPTATTNRSLQLLSTTTLEVKKGSTLTITGGIEGEAGASSAKTFVLAGEGTLAPTAKFIQNHTGAIRLDGGILNLTTVDITKTFGSNLKRLIMAGGTLKTKGDQSGYETYSFPINLIEGTTSVFAPHRCAYLNNTLSGSGNIQVDIPYVREYIKFAYSGFTGRVIANGVSTESGGSLCLIQKGAASMTDGVLVLKGNARLCGWDTSTSWSVGGISGDATTCISGSSKNTKGGWTATWTVGSANTDETFRGTTTNQACTVGSAYEGTVSLKKVGTGSWRLTNSNLAHKGATTVSGGKLIVNGNLLNSFCTVNSGATLAGTGTLSKKATISSGATLAPGDTLVNGSLLRLSGGVEMKSGSKLHIAVSNNNVTNVLRANALRVTGTLTVNGVALEIDMSDVNAANLEDGQKITVFNTIGGATVSGTGITGIEPAIPAEGYKWDASTLLKDGYLYIVKDEEATGIREITQPAGPSAQSALPTPMSQNIYDLQGHRLSQPASGVVIQNGKKIKK